MAERLTAPLQLAFPLRNNEGIPFVRPVLQSATPKGAFGTNAQFLKIYPFAQGQQYGSFWLRVYAWDQTVGNADLTLPPPTRIQCQQPSLLAELYCVLDDNPGFDGGIVGLDENYCSWLAWTNGTVSYIQNPGYGIAAWALVPTFGCNLFTFDAMDARAVGASPSGSSSELAVQPNALWAGVTP